MLVFINLLMFLFLSLCYWKSNLTIAPVVKPTTPKSFDKLPIISDCQVTDNNPPNARQAEKVAWKYSLMSQWSLRKGYTLGRARAELVGIPAGGQCLSWYDVAVRDDRNGEILKNMQLARAFFFKEENLPQIAFLFFGKPNVIEYDDEKNAEIDYRKRYQEWSKMPLCSDKSSKIDCIYFRPRPFPDVQDGEVTADVLGNKTLHRFDLQIIGILRHHQLSVDKGGRLDIKTEELIHYESGIIFQIG